MRRGICFKGLLQFQVTDQSLPTFPLVLNIYFIAFVLQSIKVQIRQDLAMDVSAASCAVDRSLCPLPPQAETPTVPGQKPQSGSNQPQVDIKNRTLVFPSTASGESSGNSLESDTALVLRKMYVN